MRNAEQGMRIHAIVLSVHSLTEHVNEKRRTRNENGGRTWNDKLLLQP
jgi:hypothetical protein